jgi:hypothetical protein
MGLFGVAFSLYGDKGVWAHLGRRSGGLYSMGKWHHSLQVPLSQGNQDVFMDNSEAEPESRQFMG